MFLPQFSLSWSSGALCALLVLAIAPVARAQTTPPTATLHGTLVYRAGPTVPGPMEATFAALSAAAGIPYLPNPASAASVSAVRDNAAVEDAPLCVRAGVGLSVPVMAGPPMTVEHGLIGCPTNTGGLPVIVVQDPALQAPPTSRTGDYNLDVTVRYRLLQLRHMQFVASIAEQGVGYSLDSPVSGNNILASLSVIF